MPVYAEESRVKVYTPKAYKQKAMEQSPKYMRVYGEAYELLVDYSGSMAGWINLAKETLIYILPKIPDKSYVALRVFGERQSNLFTPIYSEECRSTRLVSYFRNSNQENIIRGLNEANLGGMTPLEYALRQTIEKDLKNLTVIPQFNQQNNRKKIILVTDGYENCGGNPCAYIREAVRKDKKLQIDVIHLSGDNTLKCLTEETGGHFYTISDKKSFEEALEQVFDVPVGTVEEGRKQSGANKSSETKTPPKQHGYRFIQF